MTLSPRSTLAIAIGTLLACPSACSSTQPPQLQGVNVIVPAQPPAPIASSAPPPEITPQAVEVPFDVPNAPPPRPFDPKLMIDGSVLLLGYDEKDVWILGEGASHVVDRATGCVTESYVQPKALDRARHAQSEQAAGEALADPEVVSAIRELVGLGRRFGTRSHWMLSQFVWSPDGRHVFVESANLVFHSSDGGKTYGRVDDLHASRLSMAPDGKHLVYERCPDAYCTGGYAYVSLPTDRSRAALPFTKGQTFPYGMTADSRALFWRSGKDLCLDTFELSKPMKESSVCVPLPPQATGGWNTREFESVSPSGAWGVVKWEEGRSRHPGGPVGLTYIVSLVDMKAQKIVKTLLDVDAFVDDDGNMVTRAVSEGGGDRSMYHPREGKPRELGRTSVMAWDLKAKVAILPGPYKKATLGARKCDLVKFVKTP